MSEHMIESDIPVPEGEGERKRLTYVGADLVAALLRGAIDPMASVYVYRAGQNDATIAEQAMAVLGRTVTPAVVANLRCRMFGVLAGYGEAQRKRRNPEAPARRDGLGDQRAAELQRTIDEQKADLIERDARVRELETKLEAAEAKARQVEGALAVVANLQARIADGHQRLDRLQTEVSRARAAASGPDLRPVAATA